MIAKIRERFAALWHGPDPSPRFVVVCVRAPNDMSVETLMDLQRVAAAFDLDWSEHLPPDLFITFFNAAGHGGVRAANFVSKVRAEFPALRIGQAEGRAIVELDAQGKPVSTPLGGFVNDALRQSSA